MTRVYLTDDPETGFPVLKGSPREGRTSNPTSISLGVVRVPLYHEDGRPIGPTESLDLLLSDGPINESQFHKLAGEFDNPNVIHDAAHRLGVIRQKQGDGTVLVMLPPEPEPPTTDPVSTLEDATEENVMHLSDGPVDLSVNNLTPFGEAQRLLGSQSVIGSGLEIVKGEGRARYVRTNKLNALLSHSRGGRAKGAGAKIADAVYDATTRRAQSNRVGQANDERPSRGRRYRRASELSRDE